MACEVERDALKTALEAEKIAFGTLQRASELLRAASRLTGAAKLALAICEKKFDAQAEDSDIVVNRIMDDVDLMLRPSSGQITSR